MYIRRILLLAVATMMAVMFCVAPAFAAGGGATVIECQVGQGNIVEPPSGGVRNHCGIGGSTGGGATVTQCPLSTGVLTQTPSGNTNNHCTTPPPPAG